MRLSLLMRVIPPETYFMRIRKAVFPVAGLGTRFLPATKAIPKEMLPVVDRPVIQHVVDEARAAGIEHFIFVTGRNKGAIEDHFDIAFELDHTLASRNRHADITLLADDLPGAGQTSFTRQQAPLGLGHAVWCARELVGNEPFAVLLPDMLHHGNEPCLKGMIEQHAKTGANSVSVYAVPMEQTPSYGIIDAMQLPDGSQQIRNMVEKPAAGTAPSNLAISGRYVLSPKIFDILGRQQKGAGGEIQLTDAMLTLLQTEKFLAHIFDGEVFDTGTKIGFLTANVAYALARPEFGSLARSEVEKLLARRQNT